MVQQRRLSLPCLNDLRRSGLSDKDIDAMHCRDLTFEDMKGYQRGIEDKEQGGHAYRIAYFDIKGNMLLAHYRDRYLNIEPKYLAPHHSTPHVYFPPPALQPISVYDDPTIPLSIVEGEKKACALAAAGIPAIGIAGVDSFRYRKVKIPKTAVDDTERDNVIVTVPDNISLHENLAIGFEGINWTKRPVFIEFDNDPNPKTKQRIIRSASKLALLLLELDAIPLFTTIPPNPPDSAYPTDKGAPDDFLRVHSTAEYLSLRLAAFFPIPHDIRAFCREQLDGSRLSSKQNDALAELIIHHMDEVGTRIVSGTRQFFMDKSPIEIDWTDRHFGISPMGCYLLDHYCITVTHNQITAHVAQKFHSVQGLVRTTPRANTYAYHDHNNRKPDALYVKVNESRFVKVTKDEITFHDNGDDNVFFLPEMQNHEEGTEYAIDELELATLLALPNDPGYWLNVLPNTRLQAMPGMKLDHTYLVTAALFYLNPWFRQFRGLQLPLEIAEAESNSGKSTLYHIRRSILTGYPRLDDAPMKIGEFYDGLKTCPAIYVADNANYMDKKLKAELCNELARLLTEPDPQITQHRMFYNANEMFPADRTFAFTCISSPFTTNDVIERSFYFHFSKVDEGEIDSNWGENAFLSIGRTQWVADQLRVAQRFLNACSISWVKSFKSSHRLQHFEQALSLMGEALDRPEEMQAALKTFAKVGDAETSEKDPIIEALLTYLDQESPPKGVEIRYIDICDWALGDPDYCDLVTFKNTQRFGRYMTRNAGTVANITGMRVGDFMNHKYLYLGDNPHSQHYKFNEDSDNDDDESTETDTRAES